MTTLVMLARVSWRRQIRGFLVLAILGGVGLGLVMTAAASARRADTAYTRLRNATAAPDAFLGEAQDLTAADVAQLATASGVDAVSRFSYTPVAPIPLIPGRDSGAFVGMDPDFLRRVYRPVAIEGRLPRRDAVDEVVVNEALARRGRYRVGQRVRLQSGFDQPVDIGAVTIVGITRGIFDVGVGASNPAMLMNSAFLDAHASVVEIGPQPALVARLATGERGIPRFERALQALAGADASVGSAVAEAQSTNRTLRVQTLGYAILAGVLLLAIGVAIVQALSRMLDGALVDLPALVAMGFRPKQRVGLGALLVVPVAMVGAVTAAVVMVATSPLIPTGFARVVDPTRGVHLDAFVVVGLAAVWIAAVGAIGAGLAWRERSRLAQPRRQRRNRVLAMLPTRAQLGCEAALAPARAPAGVAARSALVAVVVGVAGVVAVATFANSLSFLLDHPELEGWSFDAAIVNSDSSLGDLQDALSTLDSDPSVERVGWSSVVAMKIGGVAREVYAIAPETNVHPTVRSGRAPQHDDEIALGADAMRSLNLDIGDTVLASGQAGQARLHVVGSAAYPELGNISDLSTAASVTERLATNLGAAEHGAAALVVMKRGKSVTALDGYGDVGEVIVPFHAPKVRNLREIGAIPWLLCVVLALIALVAMTHGLIRSVQTRRHEHAVLAVLGFRPRDLRIVVGWQASCSVALGAIVGAFVGVIAGRSAWRAVASATGFVNHPVVPSVLVLAAIVGAVAVGNVVALVVGRRFGRTAPAVDLRVE